MENDRKSVELAKFKRKENYLRGAVEDSVKFGMFGDNARLVEFRVNDGTESDQNYASTVVYGELTVVRAAEPDSAQRRVYIVSKLSADSIIRLNNDEAIFANEVTFYSNILPHFRKISDRVDDLFGQFYYSAFSVVNGKTEFAILLQNLKKLGYRSSDKVTFLSYDHLELMFRKLGQFHAFSYAAKHRQPNVFKSRLCKLSQTNVTLSTKFPDFVREHALLAINASLTDAQNENAEQLRRLADIARNNAQFFAEILAGVWARGDDRMRVLCHGDYLRNNVLFKYDQRGNPIDMKMIDLACVWYASPVVDLSLCLYMNTSQATRDCYFERLVAVYCRAMEDTFPELSRAGVFPTTTQVHAEFKNNAVYGFLLAANFLPEMTGFDTMTPAELRETAEIWEKELAEAQEDDDPLPRMLQVSVRMNKRIGYRDVQNIVKDIIDRGFV